MSKVISLFCQVLSCPTAVCTCLNVLFEYNVCVCWSGVCVGGFCACVYYVGLCIHACVDLHACGGCIGGQACY